jgi:hypothetical protein
MDIAIILMIGMSNNIQQLMKWYWLYLFDDLLLLNKISKLVWEYKKYIKKEKIIKLDHIILSIIAMSW